MPNKFKNEVPVTIQGVERTMRPSFAAIAEIETRTNRSIYEIASTLRDVAAIRVSDAAAVITAGVNAADPAARLEYDEVGEEIMSRGLKEFVSVVAEFLVHAVSGSAPKAAEPGEAKQQEAKSP